MLSKILMVYVYIYLLVERVYKHHHNLDKV